MRYKDICVIYMKAVDIDTIYWEGLAADRTQWKNALKEHIKTGEEKLMTAATDTRARRKEGSNFVRPDTAYRDVISATKIVTTALFSSAIIAAVTSQQEINKI